MSEPKKFVSEITIVRSYTTTAPFVVEITNDNFGNVLSTMSPVGEYKFYDFDTYGVNQTNTNLSQNKVSRRF